MMARGGRGPGPGGRRYDDRGLALVATLVILDLIGAMTAYLFTAATSTYRASTIDYRSARTFYAAEGAAEYALAQLLAHLQDGVLTDEDLAAIEPPSIDGFDFSGFEVRKVDTVRVDPISDGAFAGLYALTQRVDIHATASDPTAAWSSVILGARAQAIPIFQFGVFYDEDLEATNGPPMEFNGRVHSNGNIYLRTDYARYHEPITTPKKVFHDRKDRDDDRIGVYINNARGDSVLLEFDSRSITDPEAFVARSEHDFNGRLRTDAHGVERLSLPLPKDLPPYELVRPRDAGDGDAAKLVKFAWKADTRVTIDLGGPFATRSDVCGALAGPPEQLPDQLPGITLVREGTMQVPPPEEICEMFEWRWEAFFDGREWNLRDVLNVDIGRIAAWVNVAPDQRRMEIIYIELTEPTGSLPPQLDRDDKGINPSVRVLNGATLPNPLTIATEWPIYVQGHYNSSSVDKKPAALVGDAITILSAAWDDEQNDELPDDYDEDDDDDDEDDDDDDEDDDDREVELRDAAPTTVNAAILAGHSATPCDYQDCGGPQPYGGGIENFPRFLEKWGGGTPFTYRGSLISLWQSRKATGLWAGYYYKPPRREWSFDTDFRDPQKLPPGTPSVGVVLRSSFREAY